MVCGGAGIIPSGIVRTSRPNPGATRTYDRNINTTWQNCNLLLYRILILAMLRMIAYMAVLNNLKQQIHPKIYVNKIIKMIKKKNKNKTKNKNNIKNKKPNKILKKIFQTSMLGVTLDSTMPLKSHISHIATYRGSGRVYHLPSELIAKQQFTSYMMWSSKVSRNLLANIDFEIKHLWKQQANFMGVFC